MQASWRDDAYKLTFIVLDVSDLKTESERAWINSKCIDRMVGDVNLFLNYEGDKDRAEVEIMIANIDARRKGMAKEALEIIMQYASIKLDICYFVAKIGANNKPSIKLFEKALGFSRISFCDTFLEYTLELKYSSSQNTLRLLSDSDQNENESAPYESIDMLDMYIAFHFGQHPSIVHQTMQQSVPQAALQFPQRCSNLLLRLMNEYSSIEVKTKARALDLGCAVGGSTLELSKNFKFTRGVDSSASFIASAKLIRDLKEDLVIKIKVQGSIYRNVSIKLDQSMSPANVEYSIGDACNLEGTASLGGPFDAVLIANLLCRLPDPKRLLERLPDLLNKDGIVLIVSPYSWQEKYTPPGKWLQVSDDQIDMEKCIIEVMQILGFRHLMSQDMPAIIREHERLYQYIISEAIAFQRN